MALIKINHEQFLQGNPYLNIFILSIPWEHIHVATRPCLTIKPTSVVNNNISDDKISKISKVELGNNDKNNNNDNNNNNDKSNNNNNIYDDKVSEISKVMLGNNGDMEVVWSGPPSLEGCAKSSIYLFHLFTLSIYSFGVVLLASRAAQNRQFVYSICLLYSLIDFFIWCGPPSFKSCAKPYIYLLYLFSY